jgi:hypothetical protein
MMKLHVADTYAAIADIAARTDDPARDISAGAREATLAWLTEQGAADDLLRTVRDPVATHRREAVRLYGEALPLGLRLEQEP